ncbi:hypothetical protein MJO28_003968, partial [Puccinia striiformis f. sp. tritici]
PSQLDQCTPSLSAWPSLSPVSMCLSDYSLVLTTTKLTTIYKRWKVPESLTLGSCKGPPRLIGPLLYSTIEPVPENSDFTNRAPLAGLGVVTGCGHHGKMNIWGRMRSSFQLKTRAPPVCWTPT